MHAHFIRRHVIPEAGNCRGNTRRQFSSSRRKIAFTLALFVGINNASALASHIAGVRYFQTPESQEGHTCRCRGDKVRIKISISRIAHHAFRPLDSSSECAMKAAPSPSTPSLPPLRRCSAAILRPAALIGVYVLAVSRQRRLHGRK